METRVIEESGQKIVLFLDDDMRIVKPVYDYVKYLRQNDISLNSLKAYVSDLRIFWEFLREIEYEYDEVTLSVLGDFVDYLRRGGQDIFSLNMESVRTGKTMNRILDSIVAFLYLPNRLFCAIVGPSMIEETSKHIKWSIDFFLRIGSSFSDINARKQ